MATPSRAPQRTGRAPATTHDELSRIALALFLERGFDETTVDDIVGAAGIGRRTFFRYFQSKNDLPWGDFDSMLRGLRERLRAGDPATPLARALREALIEFNRYPEEEQPHHRKRMWLLLNVPSLQAHSMLRYASWRRVIAEYVAERRGESPDAPIPRSIAWACLGICLGSYEQWLAHEEADLTGLLDSAFAGAESVFGLADELENLRGGAE